MNQQVNLEVFNERDYPADKKPSAYPDWPPQTFHVSHLNEDSFKTPGFRPWSLSRDLGMIEATGGIAPAFPQCALPDDLCAQGLDAQRIRRPW